MKPLLFSLLIALVAAPLSASVPAPMPALATAVNPLITRSSLGDNALMLTLANLEQTRTKVKLSSLSTGAVYFRDIVNKHNGYCINLILDDLPEGRFVLSVEKEDVLRRQVILKTANGVMCSDWK
ncbi:hypothetical protein [Lewinella sp. IMCC34183]|uniref:hypothetical protein n=1 Tax=Lewinella sp. IMCC34183 TaxID=2248762 RepID=UPI000E25B509|nr:hypothetical protein [Lewinella sp. IMCC34183]